jgi:hypothetical protein
MKNTDENFNNLKEIINNLSKTSVKIDDNFYNIQTKINDYNNYFNEIFDKLKIKDKVLKKLEISSTNFNKDLFKSQNNFFDFSNNNKKEKTLILNENNNNNTKINIDIKNNNNLFDEINKEKENTLSILKNEEINFIEEIQISELKKSISNEISLEKIHTKRSKFLDKNIDENFNLNDENINIDMNNDMNFLEIKLNLSDEKKKLENNEDNLKTDLQNYNINNNNNNNNIEIDMLKEEINIQLNQIKKKMNVQEINLKNIIYLMDNLGNAPISSNNNPDILNEKNVSNPGGIAGLKNLDTKSLLKMMELENRINQLEDTNISK